MSENETSEFKNINFKAGLPEQENQRPKGEILHFLGYEIGKITEPIKIGDEAVILAESITYNPTKPFREGEKNILLARREPNEKESEVIVFEHNDENNKWERQKDGPVFQLQDPFDGGKFVEKDAQGNEIECHIIGGVKVEWDEEGKAVNWTTVLYKIYDNIHELCDETGKVTTEPFAEGPRKMKDIRIIQLDNGKIGVFTRPQEPGFGELGKIGYFEIDSLDQLNEALTRYAEMRDKNTIIDKIFEGEEWGGANELHLLNDGSGRIGVLCHKAYFTDPETEERIENKGQWQDAHDGKEPMKNYEAAIFVYDPKTGEATDLEVIVTADDFRDENGETIKPKNKYLSKVIFPGGLVRNENGPACLYVGIGDVAAGNIWIDDPFVKYEEEYRKSHSQREELPKAA